MHRSTSHFGVLWIRSALYALLTSRTWHGLDPGAWTGDVELG